MYYISILSCQQEFQCIFAIIIIAPLNIKFPTLPTQSKSKPLTGFATHRRRQQMVTAANSNSSKQICPLILASWQHTQKKHQQKCLTWNTTASCPMSIIFRFQKKKKNRPKISTIHLIVDIISRRETGRVPCLCSAGDFCVITPEPPPFLQVRCCWLTACCAGPTVCCAQPSSCTATCFRGCCGLRRPSSRAPLLGGY